MRKRAPERYEVLNQRDQPVEIHLASEVIVLPASGTAEISTEALASPQVQQLCRQLYVTTRPVAPAPVAATEPRSGGGRSGREEARPASRPARRRGVEPPSPGPSAVPAATPRRRGRNESETPPAAPSRRHEGARRGGS